MFTNRARNHQHCVRRRRCKPRVTRNFGRDREAPFDVVFDRLLNSAVWRGPPAASNLQDRREVETPPPPDSRQSAMSCRPGSDRAGRGNVWRRHAPEHPASEIVLRRVAGAEKAARPIGRRVGWIRLRLEQRNAARWVQTPTRTASSGLIERLQLAAYAGCCRFSELGSSSRAMCFGSRSSSSAACGRLITKTGFEAQSATIRCPGRIWEMSMSIGPIAASVDEFGFIWSRNGQIIAATPTAATDPVARYGNRGGRADPWRNKFHPSLCSERRSDCP